MSSGQRTNPMNHTDRVRRFCGGGAISLPARLIERAWNRRLSEPRGGRLGLVAQNRLGMERWSCAMQVGVGTYARQGKLARDRLCAARVLPPRREMRWSVGGSLFAGRSGGGSGWPRLLGRGARSWRAGAIRRIVVSGLPPRREIRVSVLEEESLAQGGKKGRSFSR